MSGQQTAEVYIYMEKEEIIINRECIILYT